MGVSLSSGRGGSRRSRRAPMSEINVTPFVDVMLVLLIIFMVTAPLLASGVPIDLPESRANALDQDPEQVTISVDEAGTIFIGDRAIPAGGFPDELAALAAASEKRPDIVLRGDTGLPYGRVMAVMGELNRAGFNSISLLTDGSDTAP